MKTTCETCHYRLIGCPPKTEIQPNLKTLIHTCTGWTKNHSIKKVFISFLKEYGADRKFYNNFDKNKKIKDPQKYVIQSSQWAFTPEGHSYWKRLHELWQIRYNIIKDLGLF